MDDPSEFLAALSAVKRLVDEGVIRHVGLCNCSTRHLEIATSMLPIVAVQNHFSLWDRAAEKTRVRQVCAKSNKNELLRVCSEKKIAFSPHGALGGHAARERRRDLRADHPKVAALATAKKASPHAVVLAWMRQKYPCVLHIVGAR